MTKRIWSHSVTDIPSQGLGPVINGIRRIEPTYGYISDPMTALQTLMEARMEEGVDGIFTVRGIEGVRFILLKYRPLTQRAVKLADRVLHWFGIHRMLPHEEWNTITRETLDIGYSCSICSYHETE